MAWKEGTGVILPEPGEDDYVEANSFRIVTLTSFPLKWQERLILYRINEDNNRRQSFCASQTGFRAGLSTETPSHEFATISC